MIFYVLTSVIFPSLTLLVGSAHFFTRCYHEYDQIAHEMLGNQLMNGIRNHMKLVASKNRKTLVRNDNDIGANQNTLVSNDNGAQRI